MENKINKDYKKELKVLKELEYLKSVGQGGQIIVINKKSQVIKFSNKDLLLKFIINSDKKHFTLIV